MFRVIHFEISADSPERAVNFYTKVFQWKINKWGNEEYWLAETGTKGEMGIDGAIMKRPAPGTTIVNTVEVPDADEYAKKITEAGGKVLSKKMPIPMVGYFYQCQDSEGNPLGILQTDMSLK